jgi:uncharacterized protein involved in type VI secretion and phage assembly
MAGLPSIPSLDSAPSSSTHTVSVTLKMDGKDVSQNPGGIISLSVYRELNKVPSAKLIISDGKVEKGTFAKSGSPNFVPGKTAEVMLGYQNKTERIFKGLVVRHSISILQGRASALELVCNDAAIRMTLVRQSKYYIQKKDKEIFKEILQKYSGGGVTVGDLADTGYTHPELVQYHCTDWDFLVMRAEANGLVVLCQDGKVSIVKPEAASKADFAITWGEEIIDFEAEMDARTHFSDVETVSWDSSEQRQASEKGSGNSGGGGGLGAAAAGLGGAVSAVASAVGIDLGVEDATHHFPDVLYKTQNPRLFHGGDMATEELSAWARGNKKRAELSQVRGRVRVRGRNFNPLQTAELKKVAARFNGKHLVTGVMHQVHHGTWQTDIQFGLSVRTLSQTAPEIAMPDASGLVPAIHGLHVGVVTKIAGDTQPGDQRIKVKIPFIAGQGENSDGVWARLATLTAGEKRGLVFRPEKGDEVILGFINDDPNDAVVLGSLHSKKNNAPVKASDENFQKGIFAKQGMQMVFDDDQKSIELKTKEGYTILLSEKGARIEIKDKNDNSIKLSSTGIDMVSKSNISIKADKIVSIKGSQVRINDP